MRNMSVGKAKRRAAKLLRTAGWCRFRLCHEGKYCLGGALRKVVFGAVETLGYDRPPTKAEAVYQRVLMDLRARIKDYSISMWNDRQRSVEDVLAILEAP